jgi:hypothetical protein
MAIVYALPFIFDAVKARFFTEKVGCALVFGRREKTKQTNQGTGRANRVVFEPSVDGKLGQYAPARSPGRNPRPLATMLEQCTVYVWAFDGDAPNNERRQYEAVHQLHDAVVRAIYRAGYGTFELSDPEWVSPENPERPFGAEWKFTLTVQSMIPDSAWQTVRGGTNPDGTPLIEGEAEYVEVFPDGEFNPNEP